MSKAIKFLEKNTIFNTDDFGETTESISIQDAITACQIQELETLQIIQDSTHESIAYKDSIEITNYIQKLTKLLKHIK